MKKARRTGTRSNMEWLVCAVKLLSIRPDPTFFVLPQINTLLSFQHIYIYKPSSIPLLYTPTTHPSTHHRLFLYLYSHSPSLSSSPVLLSQPPFHCSPVFHTRTFLLLVSNTLATTYRGEPFSTKRYDFTQLPCQ